MFLLKSIRFEKHLKTLDLELSKETLYNNLEFFEIIYFNKKF